MKKLFAQIVKFGIVGFISFGIDYVTGLIVLNLVMALTSSSYFEAASLIGSVAGFTVSVIANYILSFKFVFVFTKRVAFVDRFKQRACPRFCILIELQIIHELVFIERLEDNTEDSLVAGGFQPRRVLEIGDQK